MPRSSFIVTCVLSVNLAACTGEEAQVQGTPNVGAGDITEADLEAYLTLKRIPPTKGERRDRALETLIERNALAEAILKEPLLDKTMVEAEIRDFRNELLIHRYFDAFLKERVTAEAVSDYYDKNQVEFAKRKAKLAYIVLYTNATMRKSQKAAKLARAREASDNLQAGAPFATVAYWYSEDPTSAKKAGEIGWVQASKIHKTVFDAALSMNKGDVSELLVAPNGYYIVKLLEDPVVEVRPFEDVKDKIRYRLQSEAKRAEMERLLSK